MAIEPVVVALTGFCRTFFGLSSVDAELVASKAVLLAEEFGIVDVSDLFDLVDDVWGASLSAGIISESSLNVPEHPLTAKERHWNSLVNNEQRREAAMINEDSWPVESPKPPRYKNSKFRVARKLGKKKRRWWDKNV